MVKKIKLFDPKIDTKELQSVEKVLKSHFWASGSGIGNVQKFENAFKKFVGSDACVAVNSGTAALNLALSLIDIKNKEVILPSFTFVSTAHSIVLNGGKPIFVDVEPDTLCINPNKIKKLITKKTKVIVPVHFGGMSCKLNEITDICNQNNLVLIEDAAHAAGTLYKNKRIGKHGTAVCFSFHPVKNLAMPNGGLISINNKDHKNLRKILLARRWCGITNRKNVNYDVSEVGWNYYMNEISAVIGLEQLKKLENMNKKRRQIVRQYDKGINLEQKMPYNKGCAYHIYWILVKNQKEFIKKMNDSGIETGIHYKPVHTMTMYKNNQSLQITEKLAKHVVSIPIHLNLSDQDIDRIIRSVNKYSNNLEF